MCIRSLTLTWQQRRSVGVGVNPLASVDVKGDGTGCQLRQPIDRIGHDA
jgi:hypothetical protein